MKLSVLMLAALAAARGDMHFKEMNKDEETAVSQEQHQFSQEDNVKHGAAVARSLLMKERNLHLNTLDRNTGVPVSFVEYFVGSDDCPDVEFSNNGNLILLLLEMSSSYRNLQNNSKLSATVEGHFKHKSPMSSPRANYFGELKPLENSEKLKECFLSRHPDAVWWLPGDDDSKVHDGHWYELDVSDVYLVGGFGDRSYIGSISGEEYHGIFDKPPKPPHKEKHQDDEDDEERKGFKFFKQHRKPHHKNDDDNEVESKSKDESQRAKGGRKQRHKKFGKKGGKQDSESAEREDKKQLHEDNANVKEGNVGKQHAKPHGMKSGCKKSNKDGQDNQDEVKSQALEGDKKQFEEQDEKEEKHGKFKVKKFGSKKHGKKGRNEKSQDQNEKGEKHGFAHKPEHEEKSERMKDDRASSEEYKNHEMKEHQGNNKHAHDEADQSDLESVDDFNPNSDRSEQHGNGKIDIPDADLWSAFKQLFFKVLNNY
ncbi:LAFE_0C08438g1_1 [Lachancea fermentati]|uniref:LAFE_0C08438g1_1 n=1 Tax=Lachancea fermentati TaxID=4955 RepID=A0A1G4M9S6_LACFM|nr:LAFE_0C08438g1_1 [Lachancea fermentati]